jgi:catechol 2,3-dioxygenase-like lactoylglutathione lyase family enzyme
VAAASGAFFALSVADMKASARWYQERFGLTAVMQSPKADGAGVTVLEGGGLIVELIDRDDAVPLRKATSGITDILKVHGIVKAGVVVDDFEKTLALLKERRVEIAFGPFPAKANQRANVIVKDNEGNLIQFFGKRPASDQ